MSGRRSRGKFIKMKMEKKGRGSPSGDVNKGNIEKCLRTGNHNSWKRGRRSGSNGKAHLQEVNEIGRKMESREGKKRR